jgi:hypothetical protein
MKLAFIVVAILAALGVPILMACVGGLPRDLRDKKLDQRVNVDVEGVASVALPPTFKKEGVVNSGERKWFGGDLTSLEYHLDERQLTFRFIQGQYNTIGGYHASPVILDVTVYNSSVPKEEIARVSNTTIDRFYSPDNSTTLQSARWLPESANRDVVTRSAEAVDPFDKKHGRWLVIHTDGGRRVRVDFFGWRDAYTLEEAQNLVRDVATSTTHGDALRKHFADIKTFDARMDARRDSTIAAIGRDLRACGVPSLVVGRAVSSATCVALLKDNRRDVYVARYIGSVPLSSSTYDDFRSAPKFSMGFKDGDYIGNGSIDGLPNLDIVMLWWDEKKSAWHSAKLQGNVGADEEEVATLEPEVARRLSAKEQAHFFSYRHYDVQFHADRVNTTEFLSQAARFEADLAAGKIIAGIRASKIALGTP